MRTSLTTRVVASNGSGVATIGPTKGRKFLLVGLADGRAFNIAAGTTPDSTSGIPVSATVGFISFCRDDIGDAMDGAFTLYTGNGATGNFVVTEALEAL